MRDATNALIIWVAAMNNETDQPKRRGRPSKPTADRKRHTMTFRARDFVKTELERKAAQNERSVSEEIEDIIYRDLFSDPISYRLLENEEDEIKKRDINITISNINDWYRYQGCLTRFYIEMAALRRHSWCSEIAYCAGKIIEKTDEVDLNLLYPELMSQFRSAIRAPGNAWSEHDLVEILAEIHGKGIDLSKYNSSEVSRMKSKSLNKTEVIKDIDDKIHLNDYQKARNRMVKSGKTEVK